MPRHKTISDKQLLDALLEIMLQTGPDGLTFALGAKASGLSPATLVQRYGNREALVEAVLLRAWDRLFSETEAQDGVAAETPGGAIDLLIALMPAEAAERNATDGLLLLREDLRNPRLRARGAEWGEYLARALGRRLSRDQDAAGRLGWQMAALWQGAHTWWAFTRREPADTAIRHMLEDWLSATGISTDRHRT